MPHQLLTTIATVSLLMTTVSLYAAEKPNVIIFYADDLGYGELGCQGNPEIPTPHIDGIAKHGTRFTNGYVAATYCAPSRAGLMTGTYPTRFGFEFNPSPNSQFGLPTDLTTLPDRLSEIGYKTCAVGKWHLGETMAHRPTERGFDEFYGTLANTPFFHPTRFVDSRQSNEVQTISDDTFYTTDAYAQRSVDWLKKQTNDAPWFLYLPFNAQHAPLQAPEQYLARFSNIKDEKRQIFAAMLSAMDDAIGQILETVAQMGALENTIIFYIADNGGPTRSTTSKNDPLRGFKMTTWEGGTRVPFIAQWNGHIPAGKTYDYPVIQLDVLPTVLAAAGHDVSKTETDGVNLLPYLTGENASRPHETLYWKYGPQWAIRHGDMKLVVAEGGSGQPELYNLAQDISESTDLAAQKPDLVKDLQGKYDAWNAEQAPAMWTRTEQTGGGAKKRPNQVKKQAPSKK